MHALSPAALLAVALMAACAAPAATEAPRPPRNVAPVAPAPPSPGRDPGKDQLPLVAEVHLGASPRSFQGGDDHVTIAIDNHGRDIRDLVITAGPWLEEHGLAMGSTRSCNPDLELGAIACGPIYAGQSANEILRALPAHTGTFDYEMAFFAREDGALHPISGLDGNPLRATFTEVVDPVTSQISSVNIPPAPPPGT